MSLMLSKQIEVLVCSTTRSTLFTISLFGSHDVVLEQPNVHSKTTVLQSFDSNRGVISSLLLVPWQRHVTLSQSA